jgi:hypothetical protein
VVRGAGLWQAYCGGITRGGTVVTDFVGGAGDLVIGGSPNDHKVFLKTTRSQDATKVTGRGVWASTGRAVFEVEHEGSTLFDDNQLIRALAFNDDTAQTETSWTLDATGATGHRNVPLTPAAPTPGVGTDPDIRSKMFFRTNGQTPGEPTPICRDQMCIMWWDGSILVVAESPVY